MRVATLGTGRLELDPDRLVNVGDVPWQSLRRSLIWIKKTVFTEHRTDVPSLRVTATVSEIRALLGRRHFEPNWEFSTYYAGELLNLRRVTRIDERLPWWQAHVRGFQTNDGLELDPHWEPEPTEHPGAHLSEEYIDTERGIEILERILDEERVEYERLD